MDIPCKHLPQHDNGRKLEVLGLEIARLIIPGGYLIPIVTTTFADRINLFW